MSDEDTRGRKETEDADPDVLGHGVVADEPSEDDPERKRKRKQSDDGDSEELGRKRK
jgi:hypothetical protein